MGEKRRAQRGQVVLITLLVLAMAITVALSLISRTTTDTSITTQVEESSRAFSAAEAGIEEALRTGLGTGTATVLTPGVTYSVNVSSIGNAAGVYQFQKKTLQGSTETVWLANHDASGVLDETTAGYTSSAISVCWGNQTSSEIPAIIATLLYKEGGVYKTAKYAIDPDATRRTTNHFSAPTIARGCDASIPTKYIVHLTLPAILVTDRYIALRIRPVYFDTRFVVDSGVHLLPLQGNKIESTGSTVGGTNRKIVVYSQYRSPSTIFDAALYSEGAINK
jgi:Tfp pilus assembly protein PilX